MDTAHSIALITAVLDARKQARDVAKRLKEAKGQEILLDAQRTMASATGGHSLLAHSYGAQFGAVLAAIGPRVKAAVLMAGIPDNATFLTESAEPGRWSTRGGARPGPCEYLIAEVQVRA